MMSPEQKISNTSTNVNPMYQKVVTPSVNKQKLADRYGTCIIKNSSWIVKSIVLSH